MQSGQEIENEMLYEELVIDYEMKKEQQKNEIVHELKRIANALEHISKGGILMETRM